VGSLIPGWLRVRRWWPALATFVVLLAGLGVLAAEGSPAPASVAVYSATERPTPLPLDEPGNWLVDLNRASRAELEALPGLGSSRADAIIAARALQPFASLADLVARGLLPRSVAEGLVDLAGAWP
jgi:DNA uptake protein ComE-like DNA-binding protein